MLGGVSPEKDTEDAELETVAGAIGELQTDVAHLFKMLKKINSRAAAEAKYSGRETPDEEELVAPKANGALPEGVLEGSPVHRMLRKAEVARRFAGRG